MSMFVKYILNTYTLYNNIFITYTIFKFQQVPKYYILNYNKITNIVIIRLISNFAKLELI